MMKKQDFFFVIGTQRRCNFPSGILAPKDIQVEGIKKLS